MSLISNQKRKPRYLRGSYGVQVNLFWGVPLVISCRHKAFGLMGFKIHLEDPIWFSFDVLIIAPSVI